MKLIIKNKFFSLGQGSSVKDEQGNDAFIIKGKVFSITNLGTVRQTDMFVTTKNFKLLDIPKTKIM
jgi:uncharacterized protein YxjI